MISTSTMSVIARHLENALAETRLDPCRADFADCLSVQLLEPRLRELMLCLAIQAHLDLKGLDEEPGLRLIDDFEWFEQVRELDSSSHHAALASIWMVRAGPAELSRTLLAQYLADPADLEELRAEVLLAIENGDSPYWARAFAAFESLQSVPEPVKRSSPIRIRLLALDAALQRGRTAIQLSLDRMADGLVALIGGPFLVPKEVLGPGGKAVNEEFQVQVVGPLNGLTLRWIREEASPRAWWLALAPGTTIMDAGLERRVLLVDGRLVLPGRMPDGTAAFLLDLGDESKELRKELVLTFIDQYRGTLSTALSEVANKDEAVSVLDRVHEALVSVPKGGWVDPEQVEEMLQQPWVTDEVAERVIELLELTISQDLGETMGSARAAKKTLERIAASGGAWSSKARAALAYFIALKEILQER